MAAPSVPVRGLPDPIVAPLRHLGRDIAAVTGLAIFAGPLGWALTALLLLAVAMIVGGLTLGRRRATRAS